MNNFKRIIVSFLFISVISSSTTITNSRTNKLSFTIQSVSSQKIPVAELYTLSYYPAISGNILYSLNLNATLDFPYATIFSGQLISGCGISEQLINQITWHVIYSPSGCYGYGLTPISAGTYHLQ